MATLSDAQLLMLDTLIYSDSCKNNMTVAEILMVMENNGFSDEGANMTKGEWQELAETIRRDSALMDYKLVNYKDELSGMRVGCFVDDAKYPTDVNVIFRGTGSDYEWRDNGQGGYLLETEQQMAAAKYVDKLPEYYGDNMTVSGHSKGGNKAQYVTIMTDRIDRCVSYDGQGFSREFIEDPENREKIEERKMSITSYSAEYDYVNCLLHPIAGKRVYIQTEEQESFLDYHKPYIMLDKDGNLRPKTEQSEISLFINEYSTYLIDNVDEPGRSELIDGALEMVILLIGDRKELKNVPAALSGIKLAGMHIDDFLLSEFGDRYGSGAEYLLTLALAVHMPKLFLDDLLKQTAEAIEYGLDQIKKCAVAVFEKLKEFGEAAIDFGKKMIDAVESFCSKVKNRVNRNMNAGYQYATANPALQVDTQSLRDYAQTVRDLNKRIADLDDRMDRLYWKVGFLDLLQLLQADLLTGYSWRLMRCASYFSDTADDFERTEWRIESQLNGG